MNKNLCKEERFIFKKSTSLSNNDPTNADVDNEDMNRDKQRSRCIGIIDFKNRKSLGAKSKYSIE